MEILLLGILILVFTLSAAAIYKIAKLKNIKYKQPAF